MGNVTLKNIAEILGISITTVSKALKDYPDVNKETRDSVRLLAEKLDYKPNPLAINLRNKESKTLGVIIPRVDHNFYSTVVNGIITEAEDRGYLVIILFSGDSSSLEEDQVKLLLEKRVDGVLMSMATETEEIGHIKELIKKKIPLVLFDKTTEEISCSKVRIDDKKASFKAVEYLIETGCKNIVHFRGPLPPQAYTDRFLGYKEALEKHNITYDPSNVYVCDELTFNEGYEFTKKALEEHPETDAIFAMTDLVALGSLAYCQANGIRVPDQISIMGFSNWFMSQNSTPKLSTVHQPIKELGKEAISILIEEIQQRKNEFPVKHFTAQLPTEVIARGTTR